MHSFESFSQRLRANLSYRLSSIEILALDLNQDGTISVGNEIYFDIDNDDFIERTNWLQPVDGILAHDLNQNGIIDDISEIFGSDLISPVIKLSMLDGDNDALLTMQDYFFHTLLVWQDYNGNGYSEPEELQSLLEKGIMQLDIYNVHKVILNFDTMDSRYSPKTLTAINHGRLQKDLAILTEKIGLSKLRYLTKIEKYFYKEVNTIIDILSKARPLPCNISSYSTIEAEVGAALESDFTKYKRSFNVIHIEQYTQATKALEEKLTAALMVRYNELYHTAKAQKWDQVKYNYAIQQATDFFQQEHGRQTEQLTTSYAIIIEQESIEALSRHQKKIKEISELLQMGVVDDTVAVFRHNNEQICHNQHKAFNILARTHAIKYQQGSYNYIAALKMFIEGHLYVPNVDSNPPGCIGKLLPLHLAMKEDDSLNAMILDLGSSISDHATLLNKIIAIIYKWARLDNIPAHLYTTSIGAVIEARKVALIEKMMGNSIKKLGIIHQPGEVVKLALEHAWKAFLINTINTLLRIEIDVPSPPADTMFYTEYNGPVVANLSQINGTYNNLGGSQYNDTLIGNDGDNYINGENGDNEIRGGDGNDTLFSPNGINLLYGENGDDLIIPFAGCDYIDGGEGLDTVSYHHPYATMGVQVNLANGSGIGGHAHKDRYYNIENIKGSQFDDRLIGDDNDNVIYGMEGDDTIAAEGGNDRIMPCAGSNSVDGGSGVDIISYERSHNNVTVDMLSRIVVIDLFNKDLFVNFEDIVGSRYSDVIIGDDHDNKIWGLSGNNTLIGNGGNDHFFVEDGSNMINGGEGVNIIDYSNYNQRITINLLKKQALKGCGGLDELHNIDVVIGSSYNDIIIGDDNAYPAYHGGDGDDLIVGNRWSDLIYGGGGNNTLIGNEGHDVFFAAQGCNIISGNEGDDTINYMEYRQQEYIDMVENEFKMRARGDLLPLYAFQQVSMPGIFVRNGFTINLVMGIAYKDNDIDHFSSIERIVGTHYDDHIIGDGANNTIVGLDGNDSIYAGGGDDNITCGDGISVLYGEAGNDVFIVAKGQADVYGGQGYDALDLVLRPSGVVIDMINEYLAYEGDQQYHIQGIEAIRGTNHDDIIYDDDSNNEIHGGGGNDTIYLAGGDDVVEGGVGDDKIYFTGDGRKIIGGGNGCDTFIITPDFYSPNKERAIIVDFDDDLLDLTPLPNITKITDLTITLYHNHGLDYTLIAITEYQYITLLGVINLESDNCLF